MFTTDRPGPCAPIHLIVPLLGAATGFVSLIGVLLTMRAGLF